jgi:1-aminocyclopropane-1-carboxylate deaminase
MIEQSPTLQFAQKQGMHLHFISRERYKNKTDNDFVEELKKEFGNFYMIPEGGNNDLGIEGCKEILDEVPYYDYVFCACGTSCTYTGILASAKPHQKAIGVSVLKGENALIDEVNKHDLNFHFASIKPYTAGKLDHSTILDQYHFGGYAKHTTELLNFKKQFEAQHNIPLDYIYTSKLFYAVYDLINKGSLLENSSILIVHSGGQQGNTGYEKRYNLNA